MIQEIIDNLVKLFDQIYIDHQKCAEALPKDDPFIEYDSHDIKYEDFQSITKSRLTFESPDNLSYSIWLPAPAKDWIIKSKAFPINEHGNYRARSIYIDRELGLVILGIVFTPRNAPWFRYPPPMWNAAKTVLPVGLKITGKDVISFWNAYWVVMQFCEGKICALGLARNPDLLNHIKYDKPYLFDHPSVQKEIANLMRQNRLPKPRKTGAPVNITRTKLDLYHWVYWYRQKGETLEMACLSTIQNHAELIPSNWTDHYEDLKKLITRFDKYPRISMRKTFTGRSRS